MPWRVVAVTFELGDDGREIPVVRHELYGPTKERALEVLGAHIKSDRFLRDCTMRGQFEGRVRCRTSLRLEWIARIPR
jgi:hypothetical protein